VASIDIPVSVPFQVVDDTLCSAVEGGSNYWIAERIQIIQQPSDPNWDEWGHNAPLYGGIIEVAEYDEDEDKVTRHLFGLEQLRSGLSVMAEKYPHHFGDMLSENGDAITGDVLLQCCLFGDVVYG